MRVDTGMFGPDSVTWRHADPVMGIAGVRALFLQALHPLAMAAVAAHSRFRADPWGRLLRTAEYVGTTTYGPTYSAQRAAARVRDLHRGLVFLDPESGQRYRVDPDLLVWVHCCEVDSFLTTTRRARLRLSGTDADRYVAEQVHAAALVGLNRDDVP